MIPSQIGFQCGLSGNAHPSTVIGAKEVLKEGHTIPHVTFKVRVRDVFFRATDAVYVWKDVHSKDLFANKRVVLFALPGAFTPTCDGTHLPGYKEKYEAIKNEGIDEVYCLSVNDAFVMRQWGLSLGLKEEPKDGSNPLNPGNFQTVKLIPDGALHFTRGMGTNCVWDTERGFGERSWRYSMVVDNEVIEKMFVEVRCMLKLKLKLKFSYEVVDSYYPNYNMTGWENRAQLCGGSVRSE
jgi:peroxiredoxin